MPEGKMNLCDVRTVRSLMQAFGLRARKEFGQNFLTNRAVVEDIAELCTDSEDETILEIGPGMGTLTRELCARYRDVVALEIDKSLIPVLSYTLGDFHNVTVHNQDVMRADLHALLAPYFEKGRVSVCANLPYYITTPILMKLLESGLPFHTITVMIQSEVADRLCSPVGGKQCGAITAVLNYYGNAERLFTVPSADFLPAPSVDSAVVRIRLYDEKPYRPADEALFRKCIRVAFEQRRKTLPNALAAGFPTLDKQACIDAVVRAGLSPDVRGERLTMEQFVALSDILSQMLAD